MLAERGRETQLPRGLDAFWNLGVGLAKRATVRTGQFLHRARKVLAWEKHFADMTDAALREQGAELRQLFRRGRDSAADLERAFAMVREVAAVVHIPFSVGGGIENLDDMYGVLLAGAEKVSVNSLCLRAN